MRQMRVELCDLAWPHGDVMVSEDQQPVRGRVWSGPSDSPPSLSVRPTAVWRRGAA